jgi:hypothetical protein
VAVVFRVIALVCAVVAVCWAAARLPEFRQQQKLASGGFSPTPRITERFAGSLTLMGIAVGLLLTQRYALRWLVPMPPAWCPRCGYDTSGSPDSPCPECGLGLERELDRPSPK